MEQYLLKSNGGEVIPSKIREYGRRNLSYVDVTSPLIFGSIK